jgi:hypothetical protein
MQLVARGIDTANQYPWVEMLERYCCAKANSTSANSVGCSFA